jgi:hypothetical protein
MNGVGGQVRFCATCHRRRCIAPHTECVACRPKRRTPRGVDSPETIERHRQRQRRARQSAGVLAGFESW